MSCRDKKFTLTIGQLVAWAKGSTTLSETALAKRPKNIWMDSRKIEKGDLFVAIEGERDDGHNHVHAALKAGAVAAIVAKKKVALFAGADAKKLIVVRDPLAALQAMAKQYRIALDMPIVAVTGSNGKTTTSRFLTSVLSAGCTVGATKGNFNNHLGVPLSVIAFSGQEDIAVLELGANHAGEIDLLSRMISPDHAVITNIGYAHVGEFGGIEKTAEAKFEIAAGLPKKGGLLIVNGDDARCVKHARASGRDVVLFGFSKKCTYRATDVVVTEKDSSFVVNGTAYRLNMPGRHFIRAVLPAIFEATLMGIDTVAIVNAVASLEPDPLRGRIAEKSGVRFIVDCYNANPSSMETGLAFLEDITPNGKRCAILGDMRELGSYTASLHKKLGRSLTSFGIEKAVIVGEYARYTAEAAIAAGMSPKSILVEPTAEAALTVARNFFKKGDTVLLKGSRAVKLETVFDNY